MGIFREIPPTAGFPFHAKDLFALVKTKDRQTCLQSAIKQYLDVQYVRIISSGTAAFYLILESLKIISKKRTVIIPSFVCPLIPLAIKRAGLNLVLCDINRYDFGYNTQMLDDLCGDNGDILAVVVVHLAGIPIDFEAVYKIAKRHSAMTVEDCAQSIGAAYKGQKVGTLGDFSFFSLGRGKGPTTYQGGVIATRNSEYASVIDATMQGIVKHSFLREAALTAELIGYAIFYRPILFWTVFRLPQLFWNIFGDKVRAAMEYFDMDFPVDDVSIPRQLFGYSQFLRLDNEMQKQRQKASYYFDLLKNIKGIKVMIELSDSMALYPFITVILDDAEKRKKVLRIIERSGYGGSFVYAFAICDYDYLKEFISAENCANARYVAERTITLSTSTFLSDKDLGVVVKLLMASLNQNEARSVEAD